MTAVTAQANDDNRILNIEDTGQGFWHVEDNSLPIITIHFAFKGAGSVNDPEGKTGLVQLLSNTLDEGAGSRNAKDFQDALQNHAIELSFSSGRDHFTGKMKTLKRHAPLAFELLRDALTSPKFEQEAIDRMRAANIMRIKSAQAKVNWQAARLMNHVLFDGHPYQDNSGGTISGLETVTPDDLKAFKDSYFTRDRLIIATAGNVTKAEMSETIDSIFGNLPESGADLTKLEPVDFKPIIERAAFESDSPQTSVQMIWPAIEKKDPDYFAYRVMNQILGGGGFSSYLMEEVREKQGLTYGIYSSPVFMGAANYIVIGSATTPDNIQPMKDSVAAIIDNMKISTVEQYRLDEAKSFLIGSLPLRFSTTLSLSGAALRMQLDGRSITALDDWAGNIEKVTLEDVQRVAQRVFITTEPMTIVIAGAIPEGADYRIFETLPGVVE